MSYIDLVACVSVRGYYGRVTMDIIRTDRNHFMFAPNGIQIHSGDTRIPYDAWKLREGKYLASENLNGYSVHYMGSDVNKTCHVWQVSEE